ASTTRLNHVFVGESYAVPEVDADRIKTYWSMLPVPALSLACVNKFLPQHPAAHPRPVAGQTGKRRSRWVNPVTHKSPDCHHRARAVRSRTHEMLETPLQHHPKPQYLYSYHVLKDHIPAVCQ